MNIILITAGTYNANADSGIAQNAFVTVETNPIRYRFDGTAPTKTVGHIARSGESFEIYNFRNLATFQAINETDGNTATLRVTYGR